MKPKKTRSPAPVAGIDNYRLMVENASTVAIIMLDPEGSVVTWNLGAERLKGYQASEIVGQHFSRFYPAEAVAANEPSSLLAAATAAGQKSTQGWRVRKDGTTFWAEIVINALRTPQGQLVGFSKITIDASQRKAASIAAQKSSDYTRSLIEAAQDPFATISPAGLITDVNSSMETVTGFSRAELVGSEFLKYFTAPEQAKIGYEQTFRDGLVRDFPLEFRHREGRSIPVSYNASVYRDEHGKVIGVFAAARDITERLRAEERIRQQTNEIMELSTPVMQVWKGVVVAPLIGSLDSVRTQQFMERLLSRIVETNSPVALVDIMGVPTIDTQTAHHLIETITAVRLLGSQVILTGVRPAIAQTLVHLSINLADIITRSSLAAGLQVALNILELQVVRTGAHREKEAGL